MSVSIIAYLGRGVKGKPRFWRAYTEKVPAFWGAYRRNSPKGLDFLEKMRYNIKDKDYIKENPLL